MSLQRFVVRLEEADVVVESRDPLSDDEQVLFSHDVRRLVGQLTPLFARGLVEVRIGPRRRRLDPPMPRPRGSGADPAS